MKGIITILFTLVCWQVFAQQTPNTFKYQTSIRDNTGNLVINRLVALRMSILQGSATGTAVYTEIHNTATTDFGIANINIGGGSLVTGNFNQIDWANGPMFLRVELDLNNGTNFNFMGTSQLLAVPYALFAANAANAADDKDKDSTNELQQINLNNNQLTLNKNGGTVNLDKYLDNTDTDSQTISLQGNVLSISRGNSIVLSGAVDLDSDPINEIQNLQIKGDSLSITKGNAIVLPKDNDRDSTNELQSLSVNGNRLSISQRNQVNIDADTTNELQTLQINNNELSLSRNGGTAKIAELRTIQNSSAVFATVTGSRDSIILMTPNNTGFILTPGTIVNFKVNSENTKHVRVNLNNSGFKNLFYNVTDSLRGGELIKDRIISIIYDGVNFQLISKITPKKEIAWFVNDTTLLVQPQNALYQFTITNGSIHQWHKFLRFNRVKYKSTDDVELNSDTIIINPGLYKLKFNSGHLTDITTSSGNAQNNLPIRLFNTTTGEELLIKTRTSIVENWTGPYNFDLDGIINIDIPSKLIFQVYGASFNVSTRLSTNNISSSNPLNYNLLYELMIEKL